MGFGCSQVPETRQPRVTININQAPEAPPASTTTPAPTEPVVTTWVKYSGPWFDIQYPQGFTARAGKLTDSAYFTSADGSIQFYVFSPLWSGDPSVDVAVNEATERIADEKTQTDGEVTTHWVTITARDGSYSRSYVDIINQNSGSPVRHVFGLRYKDAATYAHWRDAYLTFKSSLVQYAD